jgi:hypothetical protein
MNFSKSAQWEINPNEQYLYYNMTLSNVDGENVENINQLMFQDRRDQPIINKISDYKMSIVRFELSTWCLPVLYFQTRTGSNDADEGCYSLTLEYQNGGALTTGNPERVFFIPQDKSKIKPPPPNTYPYGVETFNEYYYVYNFNNFIDMVNDTLELAFTKLQALVGLPLATAKKPVLVWNDDLTATLYTELDYYDITKPQHIKIYFNRPLYSLFNSFPSYKFSPTSDGKHYQILTNPRDGINCVTMTEYGPSVLIKTDQEFATNESWSPIDSIVFTTTMPVVSSLESNPTIYQNGVQLKLGKTYNNSQTIISDFQTSDFNYRSTIYYTPTAEFRWISFLNNDIPLTEITVYGYIKDRFGIIRPYYLPSNSHASIKILFQRIH